MTENFDDSPSIKAAIQHAKDIGETVQAEPPLIEQPIEPAAEVPTSDAPPAPDESQVA